MDSEILLPLATVDHGKEMSKVGEANIQALESWPSYVHKSSREERMIKRLNGRLCQNFLLLGGNGRSDGLASMRTVTAKES